MSRYKVLRCDFWMRWDDEDDFREEMPEMREITPVFNRNGQYYDRLTKSWWFEVNGKAFTDDSQGGGRSQMLWTIEAMSGTILSTSEKDDIRRVMTRTRDSAVRKSLFNVLLKSDYAEIVTQMGEGSIENRKSSYSFRKRWFND